MRIDQFTQILNKEFPLYLQEDFDNSGLQLLYGETDITNILISLDIDNEIINEAVSKNCNLIISHHPFFFKSIKKIDFADPKSKILELLIKNNISVYSLHTNLDKIYHNKLGEIFNVKNLNILFPDGSESSKYGLGSIGDLDKSISLKDFLPLVKNLLKLSYLVYSGNEDQELKNVAFLNGAGGSMVEKVCVQHKPDCIITGDVSYHNAKTAMMHNIAVIDAGHFATEIIFIKYLKDEIIKLFNKKNKMQFDVFSSKMEYDPFKVYI